MFCVFQSKSLTNIVLFCLFQSKSLANIVLFCVFQSKSLANIVLFCVFQSKSLTNIVLFCVFQSKSLTDIVLFCVFQSKILTTILLFCVFQSKSLAVTNYEEAREVVKLCMEEFHITVSPNLQHLSHERRLSSVIIYSSICNLNFLFFVLKRILKKSFNIRLVFF